MVEGYSVKSELSYIREQSTPRLDFEVNYGVIFIKGKFYVKVYLCLIFFPPKIVSLWELAFIFII